MDPSTHPPPHAHLPRYRFRRLSSTARIAQRLALVKIHKLWNSGRAEPCGVSDGGVMTSAVAGVEAIVVALEDAGQDTGEAGGEGEASNQAAAAGASKSPIRHTCPCRCVQGEKEIGQAARLSRAQQASLEATVAGVAGLPQEVLRRVVSYCTL